MTTLVRKIGLLWFGLVLISTSAWAATSAIQGSVVDQNGKPMAAADVRVENAGGSSWNKIVKTDVQGRYVCNGLSAGNIYRVSLLIKGAVRASINNVKVNAAGTALNFDLKKGSGAQVVANGKKKTHKVWMPAETGTNIGGRWVEVDDDAGSLPGADNVQKAGNNTIRQMQLNGSNRSNIGGN